MWIRRGDLFYADLNPVRGSEQAGHRPVLVIQNDVSNQYASTTIVAPLTTTLFSRRYPTHIPLQKGTSGLRTDSTVLLSQIRTIDKSRLGRKIGHLSVPLMEHVNAAIRTSLALA